MDTKWLNVWDRPFKKSYYIFHPIKWFKSITLGFKYGRQRTRKGFCDRDAWEFNKWFVDIAPQMLRKIAENGHAFPGRPPFNTPEKWSEWLFDVANRLEESTEEYCLAHQINEYQEQFDKACYEATSRTDTEEAQFTAQEKIIKNKYFNREKEIQEARRKQFKDVMYELIKYWDYLCD